jgi:sulfite exporter TauE/SafE
MPEYSLIFLGGLLGSSHCIGMCGAFAVTIGVGARSTAGNFKRQVVYTFGRLFTYSFLGAVAGFAGMRLQRMALPAFQFQSLLALAAGTFLVLQGLKSSGLLPLRPVRRQKRGSVCLAQGMFASLLTAPGSHNAFLAGLFTGFLPCGLVYAYLALAAGSGRMTTGMAVMALFGSGTIPLMLLTGLGTSLVTVAVRLRLLRAAACCVIVTGAITMARGMGWAPPANSLDTPHCPFCAGSDSHGQIRRTSHD